MSGRRMKDDEELNFWQSYSDMMAALLLIFVLIILAISSKYMKENPKAEGQGIKKGIITSLNTAFEGSKLNIVVDGKTGSITFDSSVLFDVGEYELKKSGVKFLNQFLPKYFEVLLSDKYKSSISEIIIEGHTDTKGSYLYNLELSQKRALEVAKYCLDDKSVLSAKQVKGLREILTANGRSFSSPIKSKGKVNMAASRRVEFKFRLKDEVMIEEMKKRLGK